jgi:transposase-like protein
MRRTSWIYCPGCRRDLSTDNESFVDDMGSYVRYTCATCRTNSTSTTPDVTVNLGVNSLERMI